MVGGFPVARLEQIQHVDIDHDGSVGNAKWVGQHEELLTILGMHRQLDVYAEGWEDVVH
jgi:hypothetical protein